MIVKTKLKLFQTGLLGAVALGLNLAFTLAAGAADSADTAETSIPWSQIGAKAEANYKGDGLAVIPTAEGARLRCVFQRLEGEATREGLWLTSTVTNPVRDRFRVMAAQVGRVTPCAPGANRTSNIQNPTSNTQLDAAGTVSIVDQSVRQDFVVLGRPVLLRGGYGGQAGAGELAVRLAVSGAKIDLAAFGARLVLENSGRKIAYSRLRVTDATGKELTARMEVVGSTRVPRVGSGVAPEPLSTVQSRAVSAANSVEGGFRRDAENDTPEACAPMLALVVDDADAVIPCALTRRSAMPTGSA